MSSASLFQLHSWPVIKRSELEGSDPDISRLSSESDKALVSVLHVSSVVGGFPGMEKYSPRLWRVQMLLKFTEN